MRQKILILAANPKGTTPLRLDEEVREIEAGLQRAKHREQFVLEHRWAVRPRDIQRAMLDINPQIIHFSGHGTGDEGLVFENEAGQTKLVNGEALAGLFELFAEQIECVVLNGCYSAVQAIAIAQHINYVIGMKKAIGDRAAIEFAVGFYDALGAGKSVEFAHKFGCTAILLAGIPEQLTPIIMKKQNIDEKVIKSNLPQEPLLVPNNLVTEASQELNDSDKKQNYPNNKQPTVPSSSPVPSVSVNPFNQLAKNKLITGGTIVLIALAGFSLHNQKTNNPEFYYNQGLTYAKNKEWDSAIAEYDQAIRLDSKYTNAYFNRGLAKAGKKKWDSAIDDYDQAIRLDPKYTDAYFNRGLAKAGKKKWDSAIDDYKIVLEFNPNYTRAYYNRGLAYKGKGSNDEAVKDFKKVLNLNDDMESIQNSKQQLQELGVN